MAKREYLWLVLAVAFIVAFIGVILSAASDAFNVYTPRKKRRMVHQQPKQKQKEASSNPTDEAMNGNKEAPAFDYDAEKDKVKYYNNKKRDSFDSSTVTMAYFLEIQSRLNHLKSLLSTKSGDAFESSSIQTNDYLMNDADDNKDENTAVDMMTQIHLNNMKLIEQMIENAVYSKSRQVAAEDDNLFYQKLGDLRHMALSIGHKIFERKKQVDSNWKRGKQHQMHRYMDYVVEFMGEQAMKSIFSAFYNITMKVNTQILFQMGAASLLYSCGALFYCIEHDANVSMIAYQTGIILVFMVIIIGYLFNKNSARDNEFTAAVVLSIFVCYIAFRWLSYYFNVTASFILLLAVFLAYQYKHGPIFAQQRNLDEIWICLLVNCGLPLFAYYLQCPEMSKMSKMTDIIETMSASTEQSAVEAETMIGIWLEWTINSVWYLISNMFTFLWNDFWNMLDLTYSLNEEEAPQNVCGSQLTQVAITQQDIAQQVPEPLPLPVVDDTLYWFNKIFYVFPYALFNIILISWFVTHATILLRNITLYKVINTKALYCVEILLSFVLSFIFWSNDMFNSMLFYSMIVSIPWTIGLLKYIWEHRNIVSDPKVAQHAMMYNLWFFVSVYLSFIWQWVTTQGLFYAFFSPNLLIVLMPCFFIIQSAPRLCDEFIWATDF